MNNTLLLLQLEPIPYCSDKAIIVQMNRSDYLKVVAGKLIKISPEIPTVSGARYKLVSGDNYAYFYLYCVIGDSAYFTKSL